MGDIDVIIGCESVLFAVSIYLCGAQWIYLIRKHGCRKCGCKSRFVQNILLTVSCTLLFATVMTEMVVLVGINNCVIAWDGTNESAIIPEECHFIWDVEHILMSLTLLVGGFVFFTVYAVIWIRQKTIYKTAFLAHLSNNITRFLSKYFIFYEAVMVILMVCWVFGFGGVGSIPLALVLMLFPLSIQLPLLILSVYPLIKAIHYNRTSSIQTHPKYVKLMKRVTILSALCIASDMAMALSFVDMSSAVRFVIFHLDMIINLLCVNLISADWKSLLVPWERLRQSSQRRRNRILSSERATSLSAVSPVTQNPNEIEESQVVIGPQSAGSA